eukprot:1231696-Pleurochrysis_carterae.AAC.1
MESRLLQTILGHPPDGLGAEYHDALRGHTVTPLTMETCGGMTGHACLLLRRLALLLMRDSFLAHLRLRRQLHLLRPTTTLSPSRLHSPQQ